MATASTVHTTRLMIAERTDDGYSNVVTLPVVAFDHDNEALTLPSALAALREAMSDEEPWPIRDGSDLATEGTRLVRAKDWVEEYKRWRPDRQVDCYLFFKQSDED